MAIATSEYANSFLGQRNTRLTRRLHGQGFTAKWLPGLVFAYYRLTGRHEKTGRPYIDTLQRLGLGEFKEWSELD